jgi:hypothetical protein
MGVEDRRMVWQGVAYSRPFAVTTTCDFSTFGWSYLLEFAGLIVDGWFSLKEIFIQSHSVARVPKLNILKGMG